MKGNVNNKVEIKEEDRYFYNVLMEKRIINPSDSLNPIVRKYVKVFRAVDYKKYFQCSQDDQIGILKSMNYQAAELIHDPTLAPEPIKIPDAIVSAEERFRTEEKIRKATESPIVKVRRTKAGKK
jgi:hypothetical protein